MAQRAGRNSTDRPRHAWLYALPEGELPRAVTCDSDTYHHIRTFKHDFFAATGLYRGPNGLAVLKIGRRNELATIPMVWLGAFLARREMRLYKLAEDLRGVPALIGAVGPTGFLHEFVPGHPLQRGEAVSDTFFDELSDMLETLRGRHITYVDLNKPQNVLMGDDGRPHLIDFQISLHLPPTSWRRLAAVRWLLTRFQNADRYHLLKHKRRMRPDLLTDQERIDARRRGVWIVLHGRLTRPLTKLRRRVLKRLSRSETRRVVGSGAK